MNFSFLVRLPNEKPTKIVLDEEHQDNYISQAIVNILLQTEWLEERHITIDSNQSICIIQPPHLRGKFCFPKYISTAAKPLKLVTITDRVCVKCMAIDAWNHDLFVEFGLHLISAGDPRDFTRDQCFYDMIWCDLDGHILCRLQLFRRYIGLDIPTTTLLVHDFVIPLALVWILRHFKTQGRVFSNQGRMMGSEKLKQWSFEKKPHPKVVPVKGRARSLHSRLLSPYPVRLW
ncbi:hypothetical protein Taro_001194 [Colocasia esculenta]|uniref:Uncharacterized protein n=1 Tax=Colocasia esculenta TaxID=4460 RepID=A0A843TFF3_COLES|nr:hypothetical protein [Colocasia esculenta]